MIEKLPEFERKREKDQTAYSAIVASEVSQHSKKNVLEIMESASSC